jgi:N-acylneuraminate cytidylyltransferase
MAKLCIIPARGGSKRILKKNIKYFLGKPILLYAIEKALQSGLFDEVMVSTDDSEIAILAQENGANVPFMRGDINSNDFATTFDVIEEVLYNYKQEGKEFEYVCCIYPCAALLQIEKLNESFWKLANQNYDSVFPVVEFSVPIQRALKISNNKVCFFQPEFIKYRSQDLEKTYYDAGQFYFLKTLPLLNKKRIVTDNTGYVILSSMEAQDIDNELDWIEAEFKYKFIFEKI